jgi:hypothetical protein
MNIESLQQLAAQVGLPEYRDNLSQKNLIRAIQRQRGEEACYLTDKRYTCNDACDWRASCQKLRAVWLR